MNSELVRPGFLEVYAGPMKSGKGRALLMRVDELRHINDKDFVFIKSDIDTRNNTIYTRFGSLSQPCIFVNTGKPKEIYKNVKEYHKLVLIDEVQFFPESIADVVDVLLQNKKNVVLAGLDLDFRGEPFGMMPYLMAKADYVKKLRGAICDYAGCESIATRTQKLIDGVPAHYDSNLISVENKNFNVKYEARCLNHHYVPGKASLHEKAYI